MFYPGLTPDTATALYDRFRITTPIFPATDGIEQRVSTHIYNGFAQIDKLASALDKLLLESDIDKKN